VSILYCCVVYAPYLTYQSQLEQQLQPGVKLYQDGQGHLHVQLECLEG